eukprot:3940745-Rhodomonas_salina.12
MVLQSIALLGGTDLAYAAARVQNARVRQPSVVWPFTVSLAKQLQYQWIAAYRSIIQPSAAVSASCPAIRSDNATRSGSSAAIYEGNAAVSGCNADIFSGGGANRRRITLRIGRHPMTLAYACDTPCPVLT